MENSANYKNQKWLFALFLLGISDMSNFPPPMTYPQATILAYLHKLNENRILMEMVPEFMLKFHFGHSGHSTKFFTEMVL